MLKTLVEKLGTCVKELASYETFQTIEREYKGIKYIMYSSTSRKFNVIYWDVVFVGIPLPNYGRTSVDNVVTEIFDSVVRNVGIRKDFPEPVFYKRTKDTQIPEIPVENEEDGHRVAKLVIDSYLLHRENIKNAFKHVGEKHPTTPQQVEELFQELRTQHNLLFL